MGALLRTGMLGNLRAFACLQGDAWHWRSWGAIEQSVRTGQPALPRESSEPQSCFDYLAKHPECEALFSAAMSGYSAQVSDAVADAYDFSGARVVADVGGGHGELLALILARQTHLRGILFDRESVLRGAPAMLAQHAVAERCAIIAGDFFDTVPAGADHYVLSAILHDWDDERAAELLRRVASRMSSDARVLIVENVIPAGNEAHPGKLIDLEMLLITGGRERTEAEFTALAQAARLTVERIVPTAMPISIIVARRA
jgi:O-methyltransferase domain